MNGSRTENGIYMVPRYNLKNESNPNTLRAKVVDGSKNKQSESGDQDVKGPKEKIVVLKDNYLEREICVPLKDMIHILIVSIGIIAVCVVCAIPWTTIPRSNSMIHQSRWMELILPTGSSIVLAAASDALNLSVWGKERSIMSIGVLLRFTSAYFIPFLLLYLSCYLTWSEHFGFNHPMPYLGLIQMPTWIVFQVSLCLLRYVRKKVFEENY